jgi:hypothetical protein
MALHAATCDDHSQPLFSLLPTMVLHGSQVSMCSIYFYFYLIKFIRCAALIHLLPPCCGSTASCLVSTSYLPLIISHFDC